MEFHPIYMEGNGHVKQRKKHFFRRQETSRRTLRSSDPLALLASDRKTNKKHLKKDGRDALITPGATVAYVHVSSLAARPTRFRRVVVVVVGKKCQTDEETKVSVCVAGDDGLHVLATTTYSSKNDNNSSTEMMSAAKLQTHKQTRAHASGDKNATRKKNEHHPNS